MIVLKSGYVYRDDTNSYVYTEIVGDGSPKDGIKLGDMVNTTQYPNSFLICPGSTYTDLTTGATYLYSEAKKWNKIK